MCLKAKLNAGDITDKEFDQISIEHLSANGAALISGGVNEIIDDPDLQFNISQGKWKGQVTFMELFQSISESNGCTGSLNLNKRELSISSENCDNVSHNILSLFFQCNTKEPCDLENYQSKIKKIEKLNEFKQTQFELAIEKFLSKNGISQLNSCTVLEFEDP